jgi:hypothetical protein
MDNDMGKGGRKRRKKFLFFALPVFFLFILVILFLLIQTPAFVNFLGSTLGSRLGYKINVQGISFSPGLKGEITNLRITKSKDGILSLLSPHVDFKGKIAMPLKGEIENITLTKPKLIFCYEKKKKLDLSFLKKIPFIHLLSIKEGEFELSFASSPQIIRLTEINIEIKDFSPKKGGKMTFQGLINISSRDSEDMEGIGNIKAHLNLVTLFPRPSGKGLVELNIDSGSYHSASFKNLVLRFPISIEKEKMNIDLLSLDLDSLTYKKDGKYTTLKDLKFKTSFLYDLKTNAINSRIIESKLSNLGFLKGSLEGTLHDDFPWNASFEASSINFETIYSLFKPLFPPDYQKWFIKGTGVIETHLKGNYAEKRLTWAGDMILHFKQGEFSSPDGTKAGQGIEGKVVLKIRSPTPEKKVNFELSSEAGDGEFLWGKYYKNFSGERIKFSSLGSFFLNFPRHLEFQASLDIFKTGEYTLSGLIQRDKSSLSLKADRISFTKILSLFKDYLSQNVPSLIDVKVEGDSQIDVRTLIKGKGVSLEGGLVVKNAFLRIPNMSLSINQFNLMLPFDLFYPSSSEHLPVNLKEETGYLKIGTFEKDKIKLEGLFFPLVLSRNNLTIPEDIQVSLLGGKIKVTNFKAEDILSSSRRLEVSFKVEELNLNSLSQNFKTMNLSGFLNADFPKIEYQKGEWSFQGRTVARIFGGEVEATNLSARNLFSRSRKIGGDIVFKNINLEKVTENIKIGKMTGIIKGSIKNLEIEYGQPSRFILDIDSVKTPGIQQKISVDAVENISILGTGSAGIAGVLKTGIRSFFKEYPYSRIGIQCNLENDKLSVRGKIHSGGTEYLVRRAFLRGIDVVNQNPDNVISFKDMQERISRILRAKEEKKS